MWQMTWDELGQEDVKPTKQHNPLGVRNMNSRRKGKDGGGDYGRDLETD